MPTYYIWLTHDTLKCNTDLFTFSIDLLWWKWIYSSFLCNFSMLSINRCIKHSGNVLFLFNYGISLFHSDICAWIFYLHQHEYAQKNNCRGIEWELPRPIKPHNEYHVELQWLLLEIELFVFQCFLFSSKIIIHPKSEWLTIVSCKMKRETWSLSEV